MKCINRKRQCAKRTRRARKGCKRESLELTRIPAERLVGETIEIPDRPGFGVALNEVVTAQVTPGNTQSYLVGQRAFPDLAGRSRHVCRRMDVSQRRHTGLSRPIAVEPHVLDAQRA